MSFITELQRRNVLRVALGYLAGAWLLIQILETLFPIFGLAETSIRVVVVILAIGFPVVLVLSWVFEWTPEGLQRDDGVVTETDAIARRRMDRIIFVVLVLAVAYFAVDKFVLDPSRDAAEIEAARKEGRVEAVLDEYQDTSIVVLPFANLSPDPDQEYFADGLTEEMLNLLAQIAELRVISRSTAFTFKGKDVVIPEVAEKLNVSHVLEGSVRKAGTQIRVTAQLIEASTDTHLWSQTYDRELADIFAIQDDISSKVVRQLELRLLGDIPKAAEVNPHAYQLYLQAHHVVESADWSRLDEAGNMLEQALAIEPDFVAALAELARTYYLSPRNPAGNPPSEQEIRARIHDLVSKMVEIAPESSFTRAWQGFIAEVWELDYQAAATHYERAIADNPFNPPGLLRRVIAMFMRLERSQEGLALARYNLSRDPACVICVSQLAQILRATGSHREAAERLEAQLDWHSASSDNYWHIGVAWLLADEPETALHYFDELRSMDEPFGSMARLFALYDLGRLEAFESEFARLRDNQRANPEGIARLYAYTGQNDRAFEWLEKMVDALGPGSASRVGTEFYEPLHSDPRWGAFIEKYGVAEEDLSHVEFNPPFPPALRAAIDRYRHGPE